MIRPKADLRLLRYQNIAPTEHLGIAYLTSILRNHNHHVEILDGEILGLSPPEMVDRILQHKDYIVGFSIMDFSVLKPAVEMIKILSRFKESFTHLTIGGHLATIYYEKLLRILNVDSVILYEGENTLSELVTRIERRKAWRDTLGIAFRSQGRIITNPSRERVKELDDFPFPARDTLPLLQESNKNYVVSLLSSRGCHRNCSFCSVRPFWGKWRARSPENVADEIETLTLIHNVSDFDFQDDNFIIPSRYGRERAKSIARELVQRNIRTKFRCFLSSDSIDYDTLAELKKAGLCGVFVGIESGVQRALNTFGKGIGVERNIEALTILEELDLLWRSQIGFIMFDSFTTLDEVRDNIDFLRRHVKYISPVCFTNIMTDLYNQRYLELLLTATQKSVIDNGHENLPEEIQLLYAIFLIINKNTIDGYHRIIKRNDHGTKLLLMKWSNSVLELLEKATDAIERVRKSDSMELFKKTTISFDQKSKYLASDIDRWTY